jgi:hypothetical protein
MPAHPLPIVINQGVPVCLNSDDPSVFGSMGLTYDFFQVFVSSEVSGLLTLEQLARDSLTVRVHLRRATLSDRRGHSSRPCLWTRGRRRCVLGRKAGRHMSSSLRRNNCKRKIDSVFVVARYRIVNEQRN